MRAAHPLAPIINAAFDRALSYADLRQMLSAERAGLHALEARTPEQIEKMIEEAPDAAAGRQLMVDLALVYLERLGDRKQAEFHLRRALATEPCHSTALDEYLQLLIEDGRFEEAAERLERAIERAEHADKPDLMVELASVVYQYLGEPDRATFILRQAYEWDPTRIDLLARARVILVEEERWIDVKSVIDEETAHVVAWGGERDDAAIRALAESYRMLGDRIYGTGLHNRIAEECFRRSALLGDGEATEKHELLIQLGTRWATVAVDCRKEAFDIRDRRRAALLHLRAAGLYLEYASDFGSAEVAFDRSWLLDQANVEVLELIERSYLLQARVRDLVAKLGTMAKSTRDPSAKIQILLRAARIAEDPLPWYFSVLELSPHHEQALRATERILEERGWDEDRAELLEAEVCGAYGHRELRLRLELGRLHAEKLGSYERATYHLERVLGLDPVNFEAACILRALHRELGVSVSKNGRVVLEKGYGYRNLSTGSRMDPTSRCRIGSVSKVITTLSAMHLDETRSDFSVTQHLYGRGGVLSSNAYLDAQAQGVARHQPIVAKAIAASDHVYTWYHDGTVTSGQTRVPDYYTGPAAYSLAPGMTPEDVRAIAIAPNSWIWVWYEDGTYSAGSSVNLDSHVARDEDQKVSLPSDYSMSQILDVDFGPGGDVYVWYDTGMTSAGTVARRPAARPTTSRRRCAASRGVESACARRRRAPRSARRDALEARRR